MKATRRDLVLQACRLTIECGLNGFTVEELCAQVGISRRTFFNYFASKDEAVLGASARDPLEMFGEKFVAGGQSPNDPGLLVGLRELVVQSFWAMDGLPDWSVLQAVVRREPALLQRLTESMEQRVTDLAALIARRQGCVDGDPFPRLAAAVISHLLGHTVQEFFAIRPAVEGEDSGASPSFEEFAALLTRNFELATALFTGACDPADHHRREGRP